MAELLTQVGVSLCELLDDAQFMGGQFAPVTSCTSDYRQVLPGDIYVALVTADGDGHDLASEAIERGASAVVAERPLPLFGVPQCIVENSQIAFGQICQALVGSPCDRLHVTGITGTSGKSSVTCLFESILKAAGSCPGTMGTLGCFDGCASVRPFTNTPAAPTLAHWLARMDANGCTHSILEFSSQGLAEGRIAGLSLDVACVTNLQRGGECRHGTMENYRRTKQRIFDGLDSKGVAVLNADDPACCRMLAELDSPVMTFGMRHPADVTAQIVEQFVGEQTFLISFGNASVAVRSRILGAHHVENCLAAATIGLASGMSLATIARGLEAVSRIPGRMERVECGQGYAVWIDSADTPERLRASLQAVRAVVQGNVICAVGPVANSKQKCSALKQVLGQLADVSVMYTQTSHPLADRVATAAWALRQARPGDAVLLAANPSLVEGDYHDAEWELIEQMLTGDFSEEFQKRAA
jgi:UDP-N-acetylmuramoyl-L-alanyl-D-glutamate--2,6-diaminopimelate ligase